MPKHELEPIRTTEEARERGRNGGIASGEARRKKKTMREIAKNLMSMQVVGDRNRENLEKFGIKEDDQNYTTAIVVRLMQRALVDGDTHSIRLLGELTGDLGNAIGDLNDPDVVEMQYKSVMIPNNGRDGYDDNVITPQPGPQMQFMISPADIVIYGGAAGGGKTFALLMEMLRHKDVKGFGAVIFRREYNQIAAEGGLWDSSHKIFDQIPDAHAKHSPKYHWSFDAGSRLNFAHIGREDDLLSWQGSQIAYLGFDELTHFSKHMFFYMLSRNRSTCGVRPYVRATCNPDADSWVAEFIDWWIDPDTGYAIPERSGQIRWMVQLNDVVSWFGSKEEAIEFSREQGVSEDELPYSAKSVTFIASRVTDNLVLMKNDPGYLANLRAMTEIDTERLLYGNWKIRPHAGMFFKRTQLGAILTVIPSDLIAVCRGWDLAATDQDENEEAAYTAGVLMGKTSGGRYVILDVINRQLKAGEVRKLILLTSKLDKQKYSSTCPVRVRLPQDPGQAGKEQAQSYRSMLAGYDVKIIGESGDKQTRAEPMAALWQHGFFDIMEGEWNDEYLNQLESFPEGKWKDMVDAGSSAFSELSLGMANMSGSPVYSIIADAFLSDPGEENPFIITAEELAKERVTDVCIGLHFGVNGSGMAIIASATIGAYDSMVILKTVRYTGENLDPHVTAARVLDFTKEITGRFGVNVEIYCDKDNAVLRRDLKNAFASEMLGSIRIKPSLGTDESECINAVNRLASKMKIRFAEDRCDSLIDAMTAAVWDSKSSSDMRRLTGPAIDNDSLLAFEYTYERRIKRYIDRS